MYVNKPNNLFDSGHVNTWKEILKNVFVKNIDFSLNLNIFKYTISI